MTYSESNFYFMITPRILELDVNKTSLEMVLIDLFMIYVFNDAVSSWDWAYIAMNDSMSIEY
jgi:hypothetical protein